jgi:DNA-nicking Smr family endonuclease
LVTGRSRPSDDRRGRGVIRRKFMDWLAAGPHAGRIAAVRPAHPRHGGAGAVYIVLRKQR